MATFEEVKNSHMGKSVDQEGLASKPLDVSDEVATEGTEEADLQESPEDDRTVEDKISDLMEMRQSLYRLFASLYFKEMTKDQIKFWKDVDLEGIEELNPLIGQGIHTLKHALHRVNSGTREDLAIDYAHTFLAAGTTKSERRACPYESVFTSRDGLVMQDARDDVYRYMLNEHLEPDQSLHIPEDHLSFVFEFMASLTERYQKAVEEKNYSEAKRLISLENEFFDKHISSWIDRFCDSVEGCCRTNFYRGVSEMTRGFVQVERELLPALKALTYDQY
ncbi:MAG: molecular chaperone TorD family protein [Eggerthellaceae bacterium]|nr:molecular chaperone TorD family protein [Eggerthellaceae bacterium]